MFNEYKWHPSEIAMVVESQRTRGGMLGWDLSGCNFGSTNINVLAQLNIDAFFKKTWTKDIVKELKSKR